MQGSTVHELRLCVTAEDYDQAVSFYRDVLGLREREAYASKDGGVRDPRGRPHDSSRRRVRK